MDQQISAAVEEKMNLKRIIKNRALHRHQKLNLPQLTKSRNLTGGEEETNGWQNIKTESLTKISKV